MNFFPRNQSSSKESDTMDWRKTVNQLNSQIGSTYNSNVDALLDRLGLEPKRSTMEIVVPALSVFGAGLVVGAALGVLFAPKRGEELRGDLRHSLDDLRRRGDDQYADLRAHRLDNVE